MKLKITALAALLALTSASAYANGAADAARSLGLSAAPAGWAFKPSRDRSNPPSTIYKKPSKGAPIRR
ncbi:MAG: hypothetical protein EOP11_04025 [Proteobacteria bacterium]|nr:MAG: hypothetical protein EOP11_04025 [Pseudomonadota bacterium]